MAELRIFSVTLAFTPPGPLHTILLIAPDEASASAMAMQCVCADLAIETPVAGVVAIPVDADVLRRMLAVVEGRGPGEVVSLVPKPPPVHPNEQAARDIDDRNRGYSLNPNAPLGQRAAEILRQHPETPVADLSWAKTPGTLDAADASTFTGAAAGNLWAHQSWENWKAKHAWHPPLVWAEPYTDPDWPHTPRGPAA